MPIAPTSGVRRVALVTGANVGNVGQDIVLRFIREGWNVMMTDLDPRVTEVCAAAVQSAGGDAGRAAVHPGDLSDEAVVNGLVDATIARFGRIDVLVNNAGRGVITPFLSHTAETLTATLQRNLWTTIWCCHKVLPHMVRQNHGRIVNLGADSLRTGIPGHAGYNAAKGGVVGLMVGLAQEFAKYDITVNTVSPCVINTAMMRSLRDADPERIKKFTDVVPKGRAAEVSEVVDMVHFLAREENRFITGQDISVNGGSAMP
jgi:2,3-dihydroxy-2,3-dihydro-p-cumate dehydrogenase